METWNQDVSWLCSEIIEMERNLPSPQTLGMEIKLIYKQDILGEEWSGDGARTSNVLLLMNRRGLSFSFDSMVHIETIWMEDDD